MGVESYPCISDEIGTYHWGIFVSFLRHGEGHPPLPVHTAKLPLGSLKSVRCRSKRDACELDLVADRKIVTLKMVRDIDPKGQRYPHLNP